MNLIDRLKIIMAQEFGITTDEQLAEALEKMDALDIGIFIAPLKGDRNAQTA